MRDLKIYIFFGFGISFPFLEAQDIAFDTTSISFNKERCQLVVRNENIEFDVSDIDQSKLHVHRVETVFSEKGKNALFI